MNAEQIADELIAARPYKAKPWKRRRLAHFAHARELTASEVAEFRAHVDRCIESLSLPRGARAPAEARADGTALCAGSNAGAPFCWREDCPRCSPP